MKTLSLKFSFKSDYYGVWIIAPLGTKVDGCGNYSFEQKINCYDQRSINNTINNTKNLRIIGKPLLLYLSMFLVLFFLC